MTLHSDQAIEFSYGPKELVSAYRGMLRIRRAEERILSLKRAEEIAGSVHVCVGQESVPVAVVGCLNEDDRVIATYRGHGWALACGVPLRELFAEALGRTSGTNGGRGGSAYLTAPEHRFVGENSIVGAGLPIANGLAMGLERQGSGVSVVSFGDGATNQGAAHEAIVFAVARRLPVLFVCENNYWSEMTPITATVPQVELFERARSYGVEARQVDGSGFDGLVHSAAMALEGIRNGSGPAFLEVLVPRLLGHYSGDIEHYRDKSDREMHASRDPLEALARRLRISGVVDESGLDEIGSKVEEEVDEAASWALAEPRASGECARTHVVSTIDLPEVLPLPSVGRPLALGMAVNAALSRELEERPDVIVFGEDIGIPGGTFGVTRNLRKRFGERVFDTPISESAILGAALGSSLAGLRPVVEIMWSDFLLVGLDQLINQAANVRYLSRGAVSAPMVVRMQQGITPGSCAQHSQSLEAVLAHIPGIKVGLPSTSHDAYAMLRAAIADPDPVVVIESRALYLESGVVDVDAPVEPVGGARVRREGGDALIVTWGRMINVVLEAADQLHANGVEVTVLDLRWLAPLDEASIGAALESAGGKLLIVHEANITGGFGAEIAARMVERHFDKLSSAVVRIGLPDVRVPAAPTLQAAVMPSCEQICNAVTEMTGNSEPAAAQS